MMDHNLGFFTEEIGLGGKFHRDTLNKGISSAHLPATVFSIAASHL
jgi:hypothetical protein